MLLGLITPTSGHIAYFGREFRRHRAACLQRINFASSFNTLQGRISVWENLAVFARLYALRAPRAKIEALASYFGVTALLHARYWDLSAGERTRVNLIKALLNDPELILMDEPTAALDPDIADKTLALIEDIRRDSGVSILYTSHDMHEVTRIRTATLTLTFDGERAAVERFLAERGERFRFTHPFSVSIETTEQAIPALIFDVKTAGVWITDIDVRKPTLEDVFLTIARGPRRVG